MRCPYCGNDDTQVKDSRPTEDSSAIRRRRICNGCGGRFTTFERVQLRELMVVKKSGRKVPFDRDKLARSVSTALRKRDVEGTLEQSIASLTYALEFVRTQDQRDDKVRLHRPRLNEPQTPHDTRPLQDAEARLG